MWRDLYFPNVNHFHYFSHMIIRSYVIKENHFPKCISIFSFSHIFSLDPSDSLCSFVWRHIVCTFNLTCSTYINPGLLFPYSFRGVILCVPLFGDILSPPLPRRREGTSCSSTYRWNIRISDIVIFYIIHVFRTSHSLWQGANKQIKMAYLRCIFPKYYAYSDEM